MKIVKIQHLSHGQQTILKPFKDGNMPNVIKLIETKPKGVKTMEKYQNAEIEIVSFESEDVITTSDIEYGD